MKNNFILILSILISLLFTPGLDAGQELPFPDLEATISMDFQDAGLRDILKIFSIQSGLNFIASQAVQDRKVTLYLDNVPIKEAMDKLFKANNLSYEMDKDASIFIVKDFGAPQIETVTRVFYLKYATVTTSSMKEQMSNELSGTTSSSSSSSSTSSTAGKWKTEDSSGITEAVKKLVSTNGSVIEDYRTNSLIVTDIPSRMPIIAQTIALLDVAIPQVLIEVEMLDVSKNVVDKMGFEFGNNPFTLLLPGSISKRGGQYFFGDAALKGATAITSATAGTIAFGSVYAAKLDLLRTQTDTRYLARPRLLTLNNETAEIKITSSESVGVKTTTEASTSSTSAEAERAETGVSLRVTPQVNLETKEITMFIYPQVSEAVQGNTLTSANAQYQYRDPETRSTKSVVKVKDGETVVLGGLIRNELTEVDKKVPILGDIPLLGLMFRHKDKTKDKERELLIFITPHIVKDSGVEFAQAKRVPLTGGREQNAAAVFDRRVAINSSLNNFEKIK
ncbi:MAG: secretin N-terminal domain-containing protein [Candidatus Omnitrophota bacterium]